jgi:hypothetical protein
MTNEDAIQYLAKLRDSFLDVYANYEADVMDYAIASLERDRWISVEERLPAFDRKVLAWVENKDPKGRINGKHGIYVAELKDKEPKPDPEGKRNFWGIPGYDSVWTVWSWSYFTEPDVRYWKPLPEPPKEET